MVSDFLSTANSWIGYGRVFFVVLLLVAFLNKKIKFTEYLYILCAEFILHTVCLIIFLGHFVNLEFAMVINLLLNVFVYVTLPAVFAILIGKCAGKIKNDIFAGIVVLFFVVIFAFNVIQELLLFTGLSDDVYSCICRYFEIFNHSLMTMFTKPYLYDPFPVPLGRIAVNLWWVLCAAFIYAVINKKRSCYAAGVLCVVVFCMSFLDENSYRVYLNNSFLLQDDRMLDSVNADELYYRENNIAVTDRADYTCDVPYKISEYNIEVKPGIKTRYRVEVILEENAQREYVFSLYHGYKVSSITDGNGVQLEYTQDKDNIYVKCGEASAKKLIFTYRGTTPRYMANSQLICLPEYFVYYPVAGEYVLYDTASGEYTKNNVFPVAKFNVKVDSGYEVYTNLSKTDYNEFSGEARGVSIVGGKYIGKAEQEGSTLIYSKWQYDEAEITEIYEELINNLPEYKNYSVFLSPFYDGKLHNYYVGAGYLFGDYNDLEYGLSMLKDR